MRHIKELTEFTTGIDTRIGLPNEHLDKDSDPEIINTMYATGIGLVIYGFRELDEKERHNQEIDTETPTEPEPIAEPETVKTTDDIFAEMPTQEQPEPTVKKPKDTDNNAPKPNKNKGKFGAQLMKSIDKYFGKVFGDDTIRNEGSEEQEL